MAQVLNAFQKAYVRHAVAQEIEKRDGAANTITDAAFADVMGVHPNTIKNTKKNPAVAEAVQRGVEELDVNHDYYLLSLKRRAHEELWVNYTQATGAEKRHYLVKLLDITKDVEEYDDAPDYADLSDEDLVALCLKRDVSPLGMSRDELKALVKKGDDK